MPSARMAAIALNPLATPRGIGLSVPSFGSNASGCLHGFTAIGDGCTDLRLLRRTQPRR
ncbi:MAG: hypothetical protein ACK6BU_08985 [Cyanobacteriota bacterium]